MYVLAIIEDLILRSLWTLNISVGQLGPKWQATILTTILALMETFRCVSFVYEESVAHSQCSNTDELCGIFSVLRTNISITATSTV